jgi:alcohol dehydrogenase class IV
VIGVPEEGVKVSLRHHSMLPWLALVDPNLTLSMPPNVTASTGMDAMAQVLEPFVCIRANPITDGYCRTGLAQVGAALKAAYLDGSDQVAREKMSLVSWMGGLALANAGLGAVHGFAGPLGGRFALPHGVLCARLLPAVVKVNVRALRHRDPESQALGRYQEAAQLLMDNDRVEVDDLVLWLEEYCQSLDIPRLDAMGVSKEGTSEIIGQASVASSMKTNPIRLTNEELAEILDLCF